MDLRHQKSVQAINYFARKSGNSINRLKLIKLLWLTDRYHIMRHGRIMLMDDYVAMPHGPVPSNTINISKDETDDYSSQYITPYGSHVVKSINEVDFDHLSKSDIEAMDAVWNKFGGFNQFELSDISHEYPEWKRFEDKLKQIRSSYPMNIDDFFEAPENKTTSMYDFFEELESHIESSKEVLKRREFLTN